MSIDETRLKEIFLRWYNNEGSAEETDELFDGLAKADQMGILTHFLDEVWKDLEAEQIFTEEQKKQFLQNIVGHNSELHTSESALNTRKHTVNKKVVQTMWVKWARAAAVILAIAAASYFLVIRKDRTPHLQAQKNDQTQYRNDVMPPELYKATLTLGNGKVVMLDSAGMGLVAGAGNARKVSQGELDYMVADVKPEWNTLSVPRGSRPMHLKLVDGTKVWLNVESSITFPTLFVGRERKVTITGEAYFEVSKSFSSSGSRQSFLVEANGVTTEVLGTHFNVNAYSDERSIKITLIEGSVNVSSGNRLQKLAPGEQAILRSPQDEILLVKNADVDEAIAWTKGRFYFNNADIETIMRQISRWYNVEVIYKGKPSLIFGGKIDRYSTLLQVLTILKTSGLRFNVSGNKITVFT